MPGMGTIINVCAIIIGGLIGLTIGRFLKKEIQDTLIIACGIGTIMLGIAGTLEKMLIIKDNIITSQGSMMMILSLAIGGLIGEIINIEYYMEKLGSWLKYKTGNAKDNGFIDGFVNASLVVCIGAMAVLGSINDGIYHNPDILIAKSILDFIIIVVMTSAQGKGCMFSFVSVGLFQGTLTLLSTFIKPFLTTPALNNLSLVGSILIACVGINLVFDRKIRVANLLPSLLIAVMWIYLPI